jgi:alpha-tubulin suppressor-like RCC1 family protein
LASLVNSVAQFGGLPAPIPPTNPLGGDGAVAVVGPSGGTVVTASGFGGVQFPPGALPANVIVVVNRLPNPVTPNTGPLPTTFDQYPLFYDFSTTPPVAQFAQPVTIGICQLEVGDAFGPPTQTVADRLQIAHPNPANPATVELLAREVVSFVDCAGVLLAEARERRQGAGILANALGAVRALGTRAAAVFRPTPLYAVHGGLGGKTTSFSPFGAVDPGSTAFTLGAGNQHACALTSGASIWCWGQNQFDQLGAPTVATCNTMPCSTTPVAVTGGFNFQTVAVGGDYNCGIEAGGGIRCWGLNQQGQLGNGVYTSSTAPVPIAGGAGFKQIDAGWFHACAIDAASAAWCWGSNRRGQLGNATPTDLCTHYSGIHTCSATPVPVGGGHVFTAISAGVLSTCALTPAGAAYCWGFTPGGATGDGTTTNGLTTPTAVSGGHVFKSIMAGSEYSCGLTSAGQAWCWGNNGAGALGNGTAGSFGAPQLTPTAVAGGHVFASLAESSGENNIWPHMCAVDTAGAAWCWGANDAGQLGAASPPTCSGSTFAGPCSPVPVAVSGGHAFRRLTVGTHFTCGVTTSGQLYCWGRNLSGQLGNGSTTDSSVPVLVAGGLVVP